jgi:hypothetical protein
MGLCYAWDRKEKHGHCLGYTPHQHLFSYLLVGHYPTNNILTDYILTLQILQITPPSVTSYGQIFRLAVCSQTRKLSLFYAAIRVEERSL